VPDFKFWEELLSLLLEYKASKDEVEARHRLISILSEGERAFDPYRVPYHVTASGIVVTEDLGSIVLQLNQDGTEWRIPDGHANAGDRSIFDAASRVISSALFGPDAYEPEMLFDAPFNSDIFDLGINAISRDDEIGGRHSHIGIRFLFKLNEWASEKIVSQEKLFEADLHKFAPLKFWPAEGRYGIPVEESMKRVFRKTLEEIPYFPPPRDRLRF